MNPLRLALVALLVACTASFANAQSQTDDSTLAAISESADDTAAELMSPDELYVERLENADLETPVLEKRTNNTTARLHILVDKARAGTSPTAQTMQVYLDGALIYNFLVSTGRETPEIAKSGKQYFSATPTGKFKIDSRNKNHFSKTWQAPMPYAQFFNGGIAIHATTRSHYAALGQRDSGGCVRLHNDNAKIMWDLVDQVGAANVLIEVVDNGF